METEVMQVSDIDNEPAAGVTEDLGRLEALFPFEPGRPTHLQHPLVLAYAGDAVYDLFIRQYLISMSNHKPNQLHRQAVQYVSAKAQSKAVQALLPLMTEEEHDMLKRGRNAKSGSQPKNADVLEYRHSTGFECLVGYLFYTRRYVRLRELLMAALSAIEAGPAGGGQAT